MLSRAGARDQRPPVGSPVSAAGPLVETANGVHGRVQRRSLTGVQPAAHAPGRPREGEVGHGGEAVLVGAQGEQQVRDAVPVGSSGSLTRTQ